LQPSRFYKPGDNKGSDDKALIIPREPVPNIATAIEAATRYLQGHQLSYAQGTSAPEDDAAWLVLEAAGVSPVEPPDYALYLDATAIDRAESFLRQRAEEHIPAAYIAGRMWFAGMEFQVDERVLIPRSPIAEFLLEDGFGLVKPAGVERVLDLCTGSGCIAVVASQVFGNAQVDASDISDDALAVARLNVERHGLQDRVQLIRSDIFDAIDERYDLIISNPPYVDREDMAATGTEFQHEPELGLVSGEDGLDAVRRILAESHQYLKPGGSLVCEVGNSADALMAAYPELPFSWLEFANGGMGVFYLSREQLPC